MGNGKIIKIRCVNCGKTFEDYISNHRRYCSWECYKLKITNPYIKKCLMCGKIFSVKGNHKYQKFCSYKCSGDFKHYTKERWGKLSKCWKGGEIINVNGYKKILLVGEGKYKLEQQIVMENKLGRKLKPPEIIHHINGDKLDNDISNLKIMTRKEHTGFHRKISIKNKKEMSLSV